MGSCGAENGTATGSDSASTAQRCRIDHGFHDLVTSKVNPWIGGLQAPRWHEVLLDHGESTQQMNLEHKSLLALIIVLCHAALSSAFVCTPGGSARFRPDQRGIANTASLLRPALAQLRCCARSEIEKMRAAVCDS